MKFLSYYSGILRKTMKSWGLTPYFKRHNYGNKVNGYGWYRISNK